MFPLAQEMFGSIYSISVVNLDEGTSYKQNYWKTIYLVEKQHVDSASGWEENGKMNILVQQHTTELMMVCH